MHRCGSGFLLTLAITFVGAFTGCLGKSTSNPGGGGVQSVTLNPSSSLSINVGGTQVFSASGKDAFGHPVVGASIQFIVQSGSPGASAPLSIAANGAACAGTWDASASQCSPGTPGIAFVTAVIEGVSSAPVTVYVHQHVDSIQIVQAESQPPQYDCFSQAQTWQFRGIAFSNNVDITNTVGPLNWSDSNSGVVTTTPIVPVSQDNPVYLVQATAKSPGITNLFASISGTTSNPYPYTTCLVQSISLQLGGQGQAGNSITVNNGGNVSITATAYDTLHTITNSPPLLNPPLTWSTSNPEVAAFSSAANRTGSNSAAARNNLGGATLTASCSPPTCNLGVLPGLPIYASDQQLQNGTKGYGAISVDVTSTSKVPAYTAWAATTGCADASGCSSALFSVTPNNTGANPIGAIVALPRTPNSMMFNHQSTARVYFGSNQGLMFVDVGATPTVTLVSNSSTPCNVALCGQVLTISNDGKLVVVSDTVSSTSQVYIYNGSGGTTPPIDLVLSVPGETATAAAFSPDQLKLFILTDKGNMYVYSTVDAFRPVALAASATQAAFSADGSFAYVAGTPAGSVSAYSTCSEPLPGPASVDIGRVTAATAPFAIFPSPNVQADPLGLTQNILALEPPNIQVLTAQFTQDPILYSHPLQLNCNPPILGPFTAATPVNLGQGSFTPIYAQLAADGAEMIIVAQNIHAVLLFDVANEKTSSVPISGSPATGCPQCVGNSTPLAASASTDGSQVYVAACDVYPNNDPTQPCAAGSIHIIDTLSQGDFQQVPYLNANDNNNPNMCNSQGTNAPLCLPNLIAIQPH
jgi:hypothetical protein